MDVMDPDADQLSIETPELVALEMPLAGIGSRFIAVLIDTLIWGAGLIVLALVLWIFRPALRAFSSLSYQWAVALFTFALFLLNWGYFTLFEALGNGRTPGKRIAHIRVIQRSGRSIGLFESMARNFIRYIDQIPFFYAVGVICMFVTRQHQRLGDLAAGTLVVRDREQESPLWHETGARTITASVFSPAAPLPEPQDTLVLPVDGIARLTSDDLQVLEGFFARRLDLPLDTRRLIGQRIAAALQAKSGLEIPPGVSVETFLEATARQLRDLARLR
jgi:uncharacterized RDD family membrane protein YckC